ncbi:MAG: tRNA pseudouridine(38-40) synthase TruA [Proteobacteria bacterium]|nr:tRNA pseudouridine(38-40) synthase TruA [Pseudomonadota bacterium]MBU1610662.1 tRNA pseudouridine(38-40) synthase TruA [Pseudomonadota bacterium]
MGRIKLTLAYEGTDYAGWQLQPGIRTVQGELEKAFFSITGEQVRVHGSGRTDAGVHALGQVAHFTAPATRSPIPWAKALNVNLPLDVRVLRAEDVADDFHARYSAQSKTYAYSLWCDRDRQLPQRRRFVWVCGEVDLEAMDKAARLLLGEHDFAAFQNKGTVVKTTIRTMHSICRVPGLHSEEWVWRFTACGFLKQMVRNIMGCLVAVGRGKIQAEQVGDILRGLRREAAPPTAPAHGLCLERVVYPENG